MSTPDIIDTYGIGAKIGARVRIIAAHMGGFVVRSDGVIVGTADEHLRVRVGDDIRLYHPCDVEILEDDE